MGSENKPRIVLMGLRRSGKSSIQKVVFHKLSPNETLFLESTSKVVKDDINNSSFVQFQVNVAWRACARSCAVCVRMHECVQHACVHKEFCVCT